LSAYNSAFPYTYFAANWTADSCTHWNANYSAYQPTFGTADGISNDETEYTTVDTTVVAAIFRADNAAHCATLQIADDATIETTFSVTKYATKQ
jgi:hypothetical protein